MSNRAITAVNDDQGATLSLVDEQGRSIEFARIEYDDHALAFRLTNAARSGVVSSAFMGIYPSSRAE